MTDPECNAPSVGELLLAGIAFLVLVALVIRLFVWLDWLCELK